MNINGIGNSLLGFQQVNNVRGQEPNESSKHSRANEVDKSAAAVRKEKPFYEYQREPWLTEPGYEHVNKREDYVKWKKMNEEMDFDLAQITYSSFMKQLADTRPELAVKAFGFTLDASASIKIIDYNESLTDAEKTELTERINAFDGFQSQLRARARGMMTLVDHDHETFGGRYVLNIENFQGVIDFAKLMNGSVNNVYGEWVGQVQTNAGERESTRILLTV